MQTLTWFLHALVATAGAALVGAIASTVLLFLRRWALAARVAKRATLVAALVFCIVVAEIQVLWTAPGVVAPLFLRALPPGDPSVTARALADGISEIMNAAALALVAVMLGGTSWGVARRQVKLIEQPKRV